MQWWCCFLQRNKAQGKSLLNIPSLHQPQQGSFAEPQHTNQRQGEASGMCHAQAVCHSLTLGWAGAAAPATRALPGRARTRCCTLCLEALSAFAWGKGAAGGGMGKNIQTTMTWIDLSALQHHRPASRWHKSNSGSDLSLQERKWVSESTEDPF